MLSKTKGLKEKYSLHEKDTGSTAIQIIALNEEIEKIIEHKNRNQKKNFNEKNEKRKKKKWKDIPSRRAMLKKLAKRKRLFKYLKSRNPDIYEQLKKE